MRGPRCIRVIITWKDSTSISPPSLTWKNLKKEGMSSATNYFFYYYTPLDKKRRILNFRMNNLKPRNGPKITPKRAKETQNDPTSIGKDFEKSSKVVFFSQSWSSSTSSIILVHQHYLLPPASSSPTSIILSHQHHLLPLASSSPISIIFFHHHYVFYPEGCNGKLLETTGKIWSEMNQKMLINWS